MPYIVKQKTSSNGVAIELMEKYKDDNGVWKQRRDHLGILSSDGSELLKNRELPEISEEILFMLKAKGIAYLGRNAPSCGRHATPGSRYSTKNTAFPRRIIEVGETRVLRKLCDECGLTAALISRDSFGEDTGLLLLYLAIWQACTGEAQYMAGEWLGRHELPEGFRLQDVSSGALSTFMRQIDSNTAAQQAFFEKWIAACGFPETVIYDTTVFFTYSGRLVMAEYGYDHGHDEGLPQYNFTMAVDGNSLLPLVYRILPGSVPDVVTLSKTTEALRSYGLEKFLLSADKGFYSNENVVFCLENKVDVLCGVPFVSQDAKKLRETYSGLLDDTRNQIICGENRIGAVRLTWQVGMTDGTIRKMDAWLSRNFTLASCRTDALLEKLEMTDGILKDMSFSSDAEYETWLSGKDEALKARLKKYYLKTERSFWCIGEDDSPDLPKETKAVRKRRRAFLRRTAGLSFASELECKEYIRQYEEEAGGRCRGQHRTGFSLERNHEAVNGEIGHLGISLHITSRQMTAREFVERAHARAGIETMFDMIKNDNGQDRLRSGCSAIVSGRFFLAFLSAVVRQVFGNKLKDVLHKQGLKSIDDALSQLQLIRMVEYSSGKQSLVEIPRKTREMLQAMKISISG